MILAQKNLPPSIPSELVILYLSKLSFAGFAGISLATDVPLQPRVAPVINNDRSRTMARNNTIDYRFRFSITSLSAIALPPTLHSRKIGFPPPGEKRSPRCLSKAEAEVQLGNRPDRRALLTNEPTSGPVP